MARTRRDEYEQKEHQQPAAVIAEFEAGDTDATLQAMATAILNYRRAVNQLLRAVKLAPETYYLQATSPATYLDKVGMFDFPDEKVVWLERASSDAPQSTLDAARPQQ